MEPEATPESPLKTWKLTLNISGLIRPLRIEAETCTEEGLSPEVDYVFRKAGRTIALVRKSTVLDMREMPDGKVPR